MTVNTKYTFHFADLMGIPLFLPPIELILVPEVDFFFFVVLKNDDFISTLLAFLKM